MIFNASNLIKWFQLNYIEIVQEMKQSDHHYSLEHLNPYHLEGDVWCHTCMVVLLASRQENTNNELLIAALLHDIGKPFTRKKNHEKKRVSFYSHDPVSALMSYPIIKHIEKDFNITLDFKTIIETIAMHTEVFKLTSNDELRKRLINNPKTYKLLIDLGKCDHSGRFYEGEGNLIVSSEECLKTELKKEDDKPTLTVLVGLPNCGKSTYLTELEGEVLSRDEIVLELGKELGYKTYNDAFNNIDQHTVNKKFDKKRSELIKSGKDVILDMTNLSRKARRRNMNGFNKYNKIAKVFINNPRTLVERNNKRKGKTIPSEVYDRMIMQFYPPLFDEGFNDIEWILE